MINRTKKSRYEREISEANLRKKLYQLSYKIKDKESNQESCEELLMEFNEKSKLLAFV